LNGKICFDLGFAPLSYEGVYFQYMQAREAVITGIYRRRGTAPYEEGEGGESEVFRHN
jgi:hypothetical protein